MYTVLVATLLTLTGSWSLPVNNVKTELLIIQRGNKSRAILKIDTNCKKPIMLSLYGDINKEKCGLFFDLTSSYQKLSKTCKSKVAIVGCGKLENNTYSPAAVVITTIECKGKLIDVKVDPLKGQWIRKKTPKHKLKTKGTISI